MFPTSSEFVNRIVGASFGPSKNSGNPMITVNTEVVTPAEVEIDGKQVTVAGVKCVNYYVTTVLGTDGVVDEDKTASKRLQLYNPENPGDSLLGKLEYPVESINWDNFDTKPLLGKLILTMMEPEVEERRANATSAELAKDKKAKGKIMKNPKTGQTLINYWPKVREIFGLAPDQGNVSVAY